MVQLNVKMVQKSFARSSSSGKKLEQILKKYEDARNAATTNVTRETLTYLEKCHKDVGSTIEDVRKYYKGKYKGNDKDAKQHHQAVEELAKAWKEDGSKLETLKKKREKKISGKPKNFEWNKKLEHKSKGFDLFEGCKYGGTFKLELMLPPDSSPAMLDRLYHHLFNHFNDEEEKFVKWIENKEKELNLKCDKAKKTGKVEPDKLAKTIRSELEKAVNTRVEKIDKGLPAVVDDFFVKNAEAKQLAKQFKVKVKTRLARDLVFGNLATMVAVITGGVSGGIKGGAGGATTGAAVGPLGVIIGGAIGGVVGAILGPAKAIYTGIKESVSAIGKYRRVEKDYRLKVETLLLQARTHFQEYQDISDKGGSGTNLKRIYTKWAGAFNSTRQKLAKAMEQHQGAFAAMLQESDKLGRELNEQLKDLERHENELRKIDRDFEAYKKGVAKLVKNAKTSEEKKEAKKEAKNLQKLEKNLKWWNGRVDTLRKPLTVLFNEISRMNERAGTMKKLNDSHKGLESLAKEWLAKLEDERADVLGAKTAKLIDGMVDLVHKVSPYTDAFFNSTKNAINGAQEIIKAAKDV